MAAAATTSTRGLAKTVTGYPVGSAAFPRGAPPPASIRFNDHRPLPSKPKCCSLSASCLVSTLFFVAIAVLTVHFGYAAYQESKIRGPEFRVLDAATVSFTSFNGDGGNLLTARWNMTLLIKNPNTDRTISYAALHARLWYKSNHEDLASARLPSFLQGTLNETLVGVHFVALNQYVDGDVARDIEKANEFGVTVFAKFKTSDGDAWRERKVSFADCYPLTITLSPPHNVTHYSSNASSSSSSTPCVTYNQFQRCGDFYFNY